MQTRLRCGCSVAALALALASMSTAASAQNWTGTTSTDWTVGANWDGGVAPGPGGNVIIGTTSPNPTVLGVSGAVIGAVTSLRVGNNSIAGALTIQNGSTLTTASSVTVGSFGGTGILTVTGIGSRLTSGATMTVGNATTGTLNIENGGTVTANGFHLPGFSGNGTLNIRSGGTLETTFLAGGTVVTRQANFDNGTLRALGNHAAWVAGTFTGTQLNIAAGGLTLDSNGFAVTVLSGFTGAGSLTKTGAGTVTLATVQGYLGETVIQAGTLALANTGSLAASSRVVADGAFTIAGIAGASTSIRSLAGSGAVSLGSKMLTLTNANDVFSGTIEGTGGLAIGGGTLTLTGSNTYSGGTIIGAGTLIGSAASFGSGAIVNNAALVIDQPVNAAFANTISGVGTFTKRGAGNLNLTGTSTLTGQTRVEAGKLSVNGSLANSSVTVASGATLAGSGTVGSTLVRSGATIAPGNSIGTLTVNGLFHMDTGSTYEVEIAGNGASDRIAVNSVAMITGGQVGVTALDPQTSYINGQRYTILTATGGVAGNFTGAVSRSAFLDLSLEKQPNQIDLVIAVKGSDPGTPPGPGPGPTPAPPAVFGTVAQTRNQFATAAGLDTLPQAGATLALYNSLLMLDAPSARQAFDALSGEIHASAKSALVDESWLLRAAVNDRLRSAFGAVGASPMATLNYGFSADLAPSTTGPMPQLRSDRFAVWGQGYGSWGRTDSDGNAAKLTRSTGGFLIGADVAVVDSMRLGVVAGYSRSEFDVNGRLSSGESDNYHLGLYGGGQWGALGLRLGASYTWHAIETRRTVGFTGFGDGLKADYDAGTAQVFGEVGYRIDLGKLALEPFAGLAYVNLHTDGFSETGGVAALSARSDDTSLGYSTLGLRASTTLALQGMDLTLRGGLAWRHAFGDVTPTAALAFAGSSAFTVAGLPIARDAAVVEAGLDLAISKSASLGVSYTGQLAEDAQDHAFKANLAVRF
jgi:fibronectin-binding autotransporter adhesin